MKSKDDIFSALEDNIPDGLIQSEETEQTSLSVVRPSEQEIIDDSEEDYKFTRDRIKKLADTSDEAVALMLDFARDSEHPRAWEVLGTLINTAVSTNTQLLEIQKARQKLLGIDQKIAANLTQNNTENNTTVFVGSTTDLQKFLAAQQQQQNQDGIIDVTENE